jgi:hypothetical protein
MLYDTSKHIRSISDLQLVGFNGSSQVNTTVDQHIDTDQRSVETLWSRVTQADITQAELQIKQQAKQQVR